MKKGHYAEKRGFTVVEIMIGVAIIGLLAALGIPAFSSARNKSHASCCRQNRRVIFEQLNTYCMDYCVELTPENFPNLCKTRAALAPDKDGGPDNYVRNYEIFECPVEDSQEQHDYTYVWEDGELMDIECRNSSAAIRALHNLK